MKWKQAIDGDVCIAQQPLERVYSLPSLYARCAEIICTMNRDHMREAPRATVLAVSFVAGIEARGHVDVPGGRCRDACSHGVSPNAASVHRITRGSGALLAWLDVDKISHPTPMMMGLEEGNRVDASFPCGARGNCPPCTWAARGDPALHLDLAMISQVRLQLEADRQACARTFSQRSAKSVLAIYRQLQMTQRDASRAVHNVLHFTSVS